MFVICTLHIPPPQNMSMTMRSYSVNGGIPWISCNIDNVYAAAHKTKDNQAISRLGWIIVEA